MTWQQVYKDETVTMFSWSSYGLALPTVGTRVTVHSGVIGEGQSGTVIALDRQRT